MFMQPQEGLFPKFFCVSVFEFSKKIFSICKANAARNFIYLYFLTKIGRKQREHPEKFSCLTLRKISNTRKAGTSENFFSFENFGKWSNHNRNFERVSFWQVLQFSETFFEKANFSKILPVTYTFFQDFISCRDILYDFSMKDP